MFDGVTVVDVEQGRLVSNQRVVISGNRIWSVGSMSAVPLPSNARLVEAHGKYLIPGLWDMHTHLMAENDDLMSLYIASGVTGIRDASTIVPLASRVRWRQEILAGTRIGPPRQILSGLAIDSPPEGASCQAKAPVRAPYHRCVSTPDAARRLVDSLGAAGADMIKMYHLSKPMYLAIAAEARRLGMPFGGHLYALSPTEASDSGAGILDHTPAGRLDTLCYGPAATIDRCRPVAERFERNGTWWVLTGFFLSPDDLHDVIRKFLESDSLPRMSLVRQVVPDSLGSLRVAQRVGMPIMAGIDGGPGFGGFFDFMTGLALHGTLQGLVAAGLSPLAALQAVTLNPAKFLHATDSLGTVAPGKLADLVLLDADPLANIANTSAIRAVVANGRYYDRAALDRLLAEARREVKQAHPASWGPKPRAGAP